MNVEIIPFRQEYAIDFKNLNIEWLERFFVVEPHDHDVLLHCKENIIDKGGAIFFARLNNVIVGCFALMKIESGVFELTKMAVSPNYRGHKIGQKLLQFCISHAKEQTFKKVVLYSSTKLENAIYLYRKYGFKEVPLEKDNPYMRADIKMELDVALYPTNHLNR
ncbi:GNAT family N-acetyltransferase [Galbibacter pacificus]|uniref:GNAT family N-acetyltransferase n=1 Tax=Galbibacter pacificus TaxID=2996052 RepID=A0ABT6FPI8_9FLAO|nr:GNAT family N-acetyltransferase [Galbibacter pacificus]MDG3582339.1 GNAT family N-acetyltransferase [Galbibacter pacificus]MDG3585185.1 GNAT family N-acetyltransferase [Galbibacter pacificus]